MDRVETLATRPSAHPVRSAAAAGPPLPVAAPLRPLSATGSASVPRTGSAPKLAASLPSVSDRILGAAAADRHITHPATSVRTFSQLNTAAPFVTPHALRLVAADAAAALAGADHSRTIPVASGGGDPTAAEALLQRPLGPDSIRDAVYAYLEATDRHDVVVAMLADERHYTQYGLHDGAGAPASASPPTSPASMHLATAAGTASLAGGHDGRRARQRRAHDLLRRGLAERLLGDRDEHRGGATTTTTTTALRHPRRARDGEPTSSPQASSPPSSPTRATSPPPGKPAAMARQQHHHRILPTLCGLEEAVRPDLVLLFRNAETALMSQYRELRLPPPSPEVLHRVLTQAYEPMWSAGDDANAFHLLPPTNPSTGAVLYGTINQLVEQLTCVYVTPLSTPADGLAKNLSGFAQSFLRQHRLLMPSQVLLAKLLERYLVPLSVRLGFEGFAVHGITIHAPALGTAMPPRRSQSETVLHERRHAAATARPGATGDGKEAGGPTASGSRSARPLSPSRNPASSPHADDRVSAVVEEYVRSTTAALTPDSVAAAAISRAGPLASASSDSLAALAHVASAAAAAAAAATGSSGEHHPLHSGAGTAAAVGQRLPHPRPSAELVTTYSPSASLWLTVCERVQTKVLATLLCWLQRHPWHFDEQMIRSVLHFVDCCAYTPCVWADAPSRLPQLAEFIRRECHRASAMLGTVACASEPTALPFLSSEWLDGALCGTWEREWSRLLWNAAPPSLRTSAPADAPLWTWRTPMRTLPPSQYLPCFAFRQPPSLEALLMGPSEGATASPHALDAAQLHATSEAALQAFGAHTFEMYVRGLTAAHYRLFVAFPAHDIVVAAHRTSAAYLTSPTFQQSLLARFLNSSAVMTSWAVSLLLRAAYLDGERAAAVAAALTNMSVLRSFVADLAVYRGGAAASASEAGVAQPSRSPSVSLGNLSVTSASAATTSAGAASQLDGGGGGGGGGGVHSATPRASPYADPRPPGHVVNPAPQLLQVMDRLVDLVVGFLRVNNLHASHSVFRALQHPFVVRLLQHPKVAPHVPPHTAQRVRKLASLFTPRSQEAAVGSGGRGHSPSATTSDGAAALPRGRARKPTHTFFEYLHTVPDSVEYPTVPVVQYYMHELQSVLALEPTFLSVPSHRTQSDVSGAGAATGGAAASAVPPVVVVNWRKLHLMDDWTQRVHAHQQSCLHYAASRSTVVRHITPNLEFERAFDTQLGQVLVADTDVLRTMANHLYTAL